MIETLIANSAMRWLILGLIFGLVALVTLGVLNFVNRRAAVKSTLQEITKDTTYRVGLESNRVASREAHWRSIADRIEKSGLNLTDANNVRLREKMIAAGFKSPDAPRIYSLTRLLLIFLLPGLFVLAAVTREEPPSFLSIYVFGSILGLMGLYLPALFIRAKLDRRREAVINGFPDALDLMLVCMEAGLGIEAAMDRVGREVARSHPLIAELFAGAVLLLRAGASREEAMRKMADNAAIDEIRAFTTLLIQSDRLGTSISQTLRVYAAEMREKRQMRAEEKAHRLPVLLSIPLVVFMLPTMIGVLMLPAAIRMVRDIFPLMNR